MNSRNKNYWLLLICVFSALFSCDVDVTKHNTEEEIESLVIEHNLPSLSACVIKDDSIVWQRVYGFSDRERQIKATDETIYHIGSISKLFIVTAIMHLEEQGILDITRDINDYLPFSVRNPGFPDTPITAKMLLTHTSSLASTKTDADAPGIWETFQEDQAPSLSEWIPQFILPTGTYYSSQIWQSDKPGMFELYSNVGSCVLAYIVEHLTAKDFREYCKDHIFDPLEMHHTSYYYSDIDRSHLALLYQSDDSVHPFFDIRLSASGSAKTTLNDLAKFLMACNNGGQVNGIRILAESTVDQMLTVQNSTSGRCLIWEASFGGWVGHSGALEAGATAIAEIHPQSKTAFIIFCNKFQSMLEQGNEIYGLVRLKANDYIETTNGASFTLIFSP